MKQVAFVIAFLVLGCPAIEAQAQSGVCDPKGSTTPCVDYPAACALRVTGKATPGASLDIKVDGKIAGSTKANSQGLFSVVVPPLVQGHLVEADQTTAPKGSAGPVSIQEPLLADRLTDDVWVESVSADGKTLDIVPCRQAMPVHVVVQNEGLQAKVKALQKGYYVSLVAGDKDNQHILQSLEIEKAVLGRGERTWALVGSAVVVILIALLLTLGHPLKLVVGEDGRYSNSKFQMTLWWGVAIVTYMTTVWLRISKFGADFVGLVNIPQNLFLLSGMSVLTFGAAKGITTKKVQTAMDNGDPAPKPPAKKPSFLSDLTSNDSNQLDLGDFQMLVVTLLAVASYVLVAFHFLGSIEKLPTVSLPDVDTTILAAFGLGHGAYLTKKAVGPVGQT